MCFLPLYLLTRKQAFATIKSMKIIPKESQTLYVRLPLRIYEALKKESDLNYRTMVAQIKAILTEKYKL